MIILALGIIDVIAGLLLLLAYGAGSSILLLLILALLLKGGLSIFLRV